MAHSRTTGTPYPYKNHKKTFLKQQIKLNVIIKHRNYKLTNETKKSDRRKDRNDLKTKMNLNNNISTKSKPKKLKSANLDDNMTIN
ncbi:unnamed protein product [Adineta ricciae]|uniref:Uncharacterized protein n=1 Tax=Adineta ricciae TaxID=249248 RepID=A0A815FS69_ADIRI|nr:unnamed protein product [Adineta ricciae]